MRVPRCDTDSLRRVPRANTAATTPLSGTMLTRRKSVSETRGRSLAICERMSM